MDRFRSFCAEWWSCEVACVLVARRYSLTIARVRKESDEQRSSQDSDWSSVSSEIKTESIGCAIAVVIGCLVSPFAANIIGGALTATVAVAWFALCLYLSWLSLRGWRGRESAARKLRTSRSTWTSMVLFSWFSPTMLAANGVVGALLMLCASGGSRVWLLSQFGIADSFWNTLVVIGSLWSSIIIMMMVLYSCAATAAARRADGAGFQK